MVCRHIDCRINENICGRCGARVFDFDDDTEYKNKETKNRGELLVEYSGIINLLGESEGKIFLAEHAADEELLELCKIVKDFRIAMLSKLGRSPSPLPEIPIDKGRLFVVTRNGCNGKNIIAILTHPTFASVGAMGRELGKLWLTKQGIDHDPVTIGLDIIRATEQKIIGFRGEEEMLMELVKYLIRDHGFIKLDFVNHDFLAPKPA